MKMSKKIVALAAVAAMVVTAVPVSQNLSEVKAAAFTAVAKYDFEAGTGMSAAYGTAPTVVSDSERGNVLKFADGTGSKMITNEDDASIEKHSHKIQPNSPSSLKFANPFKGRNLSGATIAMWVKIPTETAAGVDGDGEVDETLAVASGLVGFVDSEERSLVHPDCVEGGHSDQVYYGRTFFGINAQPAAYFNQIHHNSLTNIDTESRMSMTPDGTDCVGKWQYLAVSITNKTVTTYIDGQKVKSQEVNYGKRHPSSDEYANPGNDGMPYLLDFLADDMTYRFASNGYKKGTVTLKDKSSGTDVTYGKIPSNVSGYVGYTGFSGTQAGVCIDDLAFFTKAYSDSEMASLFEAAKTADGIAVDAGGSNSGGSSAGGSSAGGGSTSGRRPSGGVSKEAAAAIATSVKLAEKPEGVEIGEPISILKDDEVLGGTYVELKKSLDAGLTTILAENPDWKGLNFSKNIYMMELPLTGRQLAEGETVTVELNIPEGFDTNMLWVLRINNDGSVTKCYIKSMENGKVQFVTDSIGKFALCEMTFGNGLPKTGVVSTGLFVVLGTTAIAGGTCMLKRKKED